MVTEVLKEARRGAFNQLTEDELLRVGLRPVRVRGWRFDRSQIYRIRRELRRPLNSSPSAPFRLSFTRADLIRAIEKNACSGVVSGGWVEEAAGRILTSFRYHAVAYYCKVTERWYWHG